VGYTGLLPEVHRVQSVRGAGGLSWHNKHWWLNWYGRHGDTVVMLIMGV